MDKLSPIEPKKPLSYVTGALQLENNPVLDQEVPQDKIEKKTDNKDLLKSVKKIEETLVKSYELQRDIKKDVQKLAKGVKDSVGSKTNNVSAPGAKDSAKFESKGIFGDFKQGFKDQWKNMYGGKTPEAKTPNNAAPVDSVLDAAPKAEAVTPDTKFDSNQAEDIVYRDKPNVAPDYTMLGLPAPEATLSNKTDTEATLSNKTDTEVRSQAKAVKPYTKFDSSQAEDTLYKDKPNVSPASTMFGLPAPKAKMADGAPDVTNVLNSPIEQTPKSVVEADKTKEVSLKENYNPDSDNITTNEDVVAKSSEEISKTSIEVKEVSKEQLTELKQIDDKLKEQDPKKFREDLKGILQKILEALAASKDQSSNVSGTSGIPGLPDRGRKPGTGGKQSPTSPNRPPQLPGPTNSPQLPGPASPNRPPQLPVPSTGTPRPSLPPVIGSPAPAVPQLPGPTPTSSGGVGVEDIPFRDKPNIPKTPGPVANPGPGAAGGTATRTIGSRIASAAGGIAKTAAAGAVMLGGVAIGDTIAGKMGVGKDKEGNDLKIDEAQDDKNWNKMSIGQKMVSGIGRGIEKAGDVLTFGALSNTVRKARYDRIDAETKGLSTPAEQANVKPAETVSGKQTVPSLPSSINTSSATPVDTAPSTTRPAEAVTEQQSTPTISPQRRQLLKSFYRLNHEFPKGTTEEEKKVILESFKKDNAQLDTTLKNTDDALAPKVVPAETTAGKSVPAITPGGPGDTIASGNGTSAEASPLGPTTDKGFAAGATTPTDKLATSLAPREGILDKITSALTPRETGGPVTTDKEYLVGEKGPEKFVPAGNGTIVPNSEIAPKPRARQSINIAPGDYPAAAEPKARQALDIKPGDYPAAGNSPVTSVTPIGSGAPDIRLLEGSKPLTAAPMGSGEPDQRLLGGRPMTTNTQTAPVTSVTAMGSGAPDTRLLEGSKSPTATPMGSGGPDLRLLGGRPVTSNTYNEAPNVSPVSNPGGNAPDLRQLSNDNKDMEREVSNKGSSVQPIISNTISNNNTQTFVPLKPTPRSEHGSSAERYLNRVAVY